MCDKNNKIIHLYIGTTIEVRENILTLKITTKYNKKYTIQY